MIASVVVTLDEDAGSVSQNILAELSSLPGIEIGVLSDSARRVPILIDSPDPESLENITRRLQECRGIACVDVVFVHFETESESAAAAFSGGTDQP